MGIPRKNTPSLNVTALNDYFAERYWSVSRLMSLWFPRGGRTKMGRHRCLCALPLVGIVNRRANRCEALSALPMF
jgi:hypothetical protein